MRKILALTLILAAALTAATNKNIPGFIATNANDRPVVQSISDSLVGSADTAFISCGIGASYCQTSVFNSARNALAGSNLGKPSAVVSTNPDSIICSFVAMRKDADTSDGSAGLFLNIGSSTSPVWTLYGGAVTAVPTNAALTKYRVAAPFAAGRQFRPWITITTTTDTIRQRFVECGAK